MDDRGGTRLRWMSQRWRRFKEARGWLRTRGYFGSANPCAARSGRLHAASMPIKGHETAETRATPWTTTGWNILMTSETASYGGNTGNNSSRFRFSNSRNRIPPSLLSLAKAFRSFFFMVRKRWRGENRRSWGEKGNFGKKQEFD